MFTTPETAVMHEAISDLLDILIEEEVSDIVNERGHDYLFGKEEEEIRADEVDPDMQSVNAPNVDIFGQVLGKKSTFEIQCPNCKRTLAAVRFAPHLEKCMGMGRNSSRIASRRLAAAAGIGNSSSNSFVSSVDTQRTTVPGSSSTSVASSAISQNANNGDNPSDDDHFEEADDDEDWTMEKKRRSKKAMDKTSSRRQKDSRSHTYDKE